MTSESSSAAPDVDGLLKALAAALAGEGPAVAVSPDSANFTLESTDIPGSDPEDDPVAVIVGTSGSTGAPKRTLLPVSALAHSAMATAIRLGGEGQWLLALPTHYVAGVQVLVRSLFAGTRPEVLLGSFSVDAFVSAAAEMTDPFRLTSLVPTQLARLLDTPEALPALQRFNAILLGGAPASGQLLEHARAAGLKVVTTYGSAETCGGCVYDGVPLEGTEVAIETDADGQPRIWLGGDTIALGYHDEDHRTKQAFRVVDGMRWYRTDDLGEISADGTLRVLGRADDVVITGGLKVSAAHVVARLTALDDVKDAFVYGCAHPEWGQELRAAVVLNPQRDLSSLADVAAQARTQLLSHELPKRFMALDSLPLLPNGKIDRQRLIGMLASMDEHDVSKEGH